MRPTAILSFLLVSFLNFAQDKPYSELSVEVGVKYNFMTQASEQGANACAGLCYDDYTMDKTSSFGSKGYIQLSYTRNRIMIPFSLGYLRWEETLLGSARNGITLFGTEYFDHADLTYKCYSEYGSLSTGFGFNILGSSEKMFLGPILRANYTALIGNETSIITNRSESTTNSQTYIGEATDYLTDITLQKHTLVPSIGLLFRLNTKKAIQFNLEAGYDWVNRSSFSMGRIDPIKGGIYAQFSLGFNLGKFAITSDK